ncbi:unnamed protein product, partial [Ectocarpus sp. 12 AP-2014]
MQEDGLWLSRKQCQTLCQPRLRRECFGALIQIHGSDHRWFEGRGLVGKYVDVYEMPDVHIQLPAKGVALPCSIFDSHKQCVTHAAITENKHLSAVLAHIKKEQENVASSP